MKKTGAWVIAALLAFSCLFGALAEPTVIEPDMSLAVEKSVSDSLAETNPEVEGESPLTGLKTDESYTPITLVLDNSPEVYPHWGVAEADWLIQVPIRKDGGTRLIALYGGAYPEQAGGVRSARMTTLPVATMFTAAMACGGWPPNSSEDISVAYWIDKWDFNKPIRYYNLLGGKYRERVDFLPEPQNLSAHIDQIHQSLAERKVRFQKRSFLFSDLPLTGGDAATSVSTDFLAWNKDPEKRLRNENSSASFAYEAGKGYLRTSKAGLYTDRKSGEPVVFANLVILRCPIEWGGGDYSYYRNHLAGSGQAEFFQDGRHFSGAWYRAGKQSRLVLLDESGKEISLRRGKTFLIIGDEHVRISCE